MKFQIIMVAVTSLIVFFLLSTSAMPVPDQGAGVGPAEWDPFLQLCPMVDCPFEWLPCDWSEREPTTFPGMYGATCYGCPRCKEGWTVPNPDQPPPHWPPQGHYPQGQREEVESKATSTTGSIPETKPTAASTSTSTTSTATSTSTSMATSTAQPSAAAAQSSPTTTVKSTPQVVTRANAETKPRPVETLTATPPPHGSTVKQESEDESSEKESSEESKRPTTTIVATGKLADPTTIKESKTSKATRRTTESERSRSPSTFKEGTTSRATTKTPVSEGSHGSSTVLKEGTVSKATPKTPEFEGYHSPSTSSPLPDDTDTTTYPGKTTTLSKLQELEESFDANSADPFKQKVLVTRSDKPRKSGGQQEFNVNPPYNMEGPPGETLTEEERDAMMISVGKCPIYDCVIPLACAPSEAVMSYELFEGVLCAACPKCPER